MKKNIVWLLLIFAGLISCSGSGNKTVANNKSSQEIQMNWKIIQKGNQCAVKKETNLLIKTEEEFSDVWKKAFEGSNMAPAKPQVDFSKSWIVAAFMGEVMTGGYSLDMQSVDNVADSSIITLKHIKPGQGCMTSEALEYPFLFVSVAQFTSEKTGFKIVTVFSKCD